MDWETVSYETWWIFFTIKIVNGVVEVKKDGKKTTSPSRKSGKGKPPKKILDALGLDSSLHEEVVLVEPGDDGNAILSKDCETKAV